MKLMLIWPTPAPEMQILLEEVERAGHAIVYWVGEKPVAHLAPHGAIFHDHYDAWDGKPAEAYRAEMFPPPSAGLIASCYELESLMLTMMNKHYDRAPVDERKHIYYTMLAYWKAMLDRHQPDAIIFNDIPHSLYSNVLFELARARGIRTVMFEATGVAGTVIRYEDFWKGNPELAAAVKKHAGKRENPQMLSPRMRAYWNEHVSARDYSPLWYLSRQKAQTRGIGLARIRANAALLALKKGTLVSLAFGFIARALKSDLRDEYRKVMRPPADFSRPFVYFALAFQPERTTSPQGGMFHDQILAAETLAAALPEGWELYVKEHPSQWYLRGKTRYSSARYRGYYERLARIPRARLIPIELPGKRLVDASRAVATVTGTAGFEALLWGKAPLVFGTAWYRDCPGVIEVRSVEDCARAFSDTQKGTQVRTEEILPFVKALDEVSIRTNIGEKSWDIGNEASIRALARSALAALGHVRDR